MEYHKMKIAEINCETGEQIIRDATKTELDQAKLDSKVLAKELVEAETKAQAKAALLTKLGITAEEARLLLS